MMKRMVSYLLVGLLLIAYSPQIFAASQGEAVQLIINSEIVKPDSPPIMMKGYTLVSLESLEKLNLNLKWDAKLKSVTVKSGAFKETLTLQVGKKEAILGQMKLSLQIPPQIKNNRVLVPLRFISEAFKADVKWIQNTNTVQIRSYEKIKDYTTLYNGDDLLSARKIAVSLPTTDTNKLSNSQEMAYHSLYFPEGEALRYYENWGNLVSYFEIKNDVKRLVWEAVDKNATGYAKEVGKKPSPEKSQVYFELERDSNDVNYGYVGANEILKGKASLDKNLLASIILTIPNEKRIDQLK